MARVLQHLGAGQPRAGGKPVAHDVGDELRPALPPQVGRDHGAVGGADQPADLLDARRDAAVHLAGAEHGVRLAALAGATMDVAGRGQVDEDGAGDAAERLAPADDAGNGLLVHAVLQRHDEAVGRQVLPDQHRCPGRVVGLHAHEGDVDRLLLGELLHLGQVERAHRHGEFGDLLGVRDAQPVRLHVVDVLGPGIDERHVLARPRHVRARIPADRSRPDDGNLAAHALLPACPTCRG